jgi:hypothetical protein
MGLFRGTDRRASSAAFGLLAGLGLPVYHSGLIGADRNIRLLAGKLCAAHVGSEELAIKKLAEAKFCTGAVSVLEAATLKLRTAEICLTKHCSRKDDLVKVILG